MRDMTDLERRVLDEVIALSRRGEPFVMIRMAILAKTTTSSIGNALSRLSRAGRLQFDWCWTPDKNRAYRFTGPGDISTPWPQTEKMAPATRAAIRNIKSAPALHEAEILRRKLDKEEARRRHQQFWLSQERAPKRGGPDRVFIDKETRQALQGF